MSKKSIVARQKKRERMVAKFAIKRAELKKNNDEKSLLALDKLPRNGSSVRLRNRCLMTGRPRGYMRYFGISRIIFRDMALFAKIPGIKKASW
ncbi:MAG: 30S ribosomal protein S14 [Alphaproteobacteria bacterium]|nr:30S ribosomal protein S14 [Alphaproteobacteria bacterium]